MITEKLELAVNDLCMVRGMEPAEIMETDVSKWDQKERDELAYIFVNTYARAIDLMLETSWYSYHGYNALRQKPEALNTFGAMLNLFETTTFAHYEIMCKLPSLESRVLWTLMQLPRDVQTIKTEEGLPNANNGMDALLRRLTVFELLITGRTREFNSLVMPTATLMSQDVLRGQQMAFWHHLGEFVALHEVKKMPNSQYLNGVEDTIAEMRKFLGGRESRDVLYSIANLRYLGGPKSPLRYPEKRTRIPASNKKAALELARKSLEDEAANGTNQVVQRISAMALRKMAMDTPESEGGIGYSGD